MQSLCQHCRSFRLQSLSDANSYCIEIHIGIIGRGLASNCLLCTLISEAIQNDDQSKQCLTQFPDQCYIELRFTSTSALKIQDTNKKYFNWMNLRVAPRFSYQPIDPNGKARFPFVESSAGIKFYIAADADSAAATSGDVAGKYLGSDPDSPEYYHTVRKWIQNCRSSESHTLCKKTFSRSLVIDAENAKLPTRCIEVFDDHFILVETSNSMTGAYVTLSHRWNNQTELCKTMPSNYEARTKGESLCTLPKTFRDAVRVTKSLGYRFLWIDSLCIIQTRDDWDRECLKMANYYQGAILNISATEASPEGGFLSANLTKPFNRLFCLPYIDVDGRQNGHFYLYRDTPSRILDAYEVGVSNSSLFKRGWVYQERLLSRRTIYFTPHQVYFECQTSAPTMIDYHEIQSQKAILKRDVCFDSENIVDKWCEIVAEYSQLHLTKSEDRIAALSGIASEIREAMKKSNRNLSSPGYLAYVAGMWVKDLHHSLMWEHIGNPTHQTNKQFPSWSWASIQSPILWRDRCSSMQPAATFLQLKAEKPKTGDAYLTAPKTGSSQIHLEAFDVDNSYTILILKTKALEVIPSERLECTTLAKFVARATFETYKDTDTEALEGWRGVSSPSHPEIIVGWAKFERPNDIPNTTIYALHIHTSRAQDGLLFGYCSFTHPVYHVLLCVKANDVYRRVGVGRFFAKEIVQEFSQARDQVVRLR